MTSDEQNDKTIPYRHVPWAVAVTDQLGGTVGWREVFELAVVDYGNNELWRGTPGQQPAYQIHTQTRATKVGATVAGADHLTTY